MLGVQSSGINTMKTILITNKYTGFPLEILLDEIPTGFEAMFLREQTDEALLLQAREADYILAGGRLRVTREVLDNAPRLKMIQRSGVGLDALDLDALREKGIPLYVNQGVNAESVAEHALLLMLACLRRLNVIDRNTKNGAWNKQAQGVQTHELHGKTVGLVGMGNIARTLVGLLRPFGVQVLYYDLFRRPETYERENGLQFVSLDELFTRADIVSLHCALTDETRNMVDARRVATMKDGAIIVNTARGPIVNAADLAAALRSGKLGFAGIDVHDPEPFPADYPLRDIENVILTPHIAGVTYESFRSMMHDAMRNISLFEKGRLDEITQYRYL